MAGIFDTGIFDTGIFDHAVQSSYGGGGGGAGGASAGAPIWPGAFEHLFKKRKPNKKEIVREVAQVIDDISPKLSEAEAEAIARRMLEQITLRQLRQIATLEAFAARVEAELAEMDDEEVLLLAA